MHADTTFSFSECSSPQVVESVPQRVAGKVNAFQQLLLVKAFRPDRLQSAMTAFVCTVLNVPSVTPPPFSLKVRHDGVVKGFRGLGV